MLNIKEVAFAPAQSHEDLHGICS